MTSKRINEIPAERLRRELQAMGMDHRGPRGDLVNRLAQAGVYEVNISVPPLPLKIDRSSRFPNHTSILLGRGAILEENDDDKLIISNNEKNSPLIEGNFKNNTIKINDCINLKNSKVNADIKGEEGDLRQNEGIIYMYRKTNCHEGWYPLQFGTMVLI